MLILGEMLKNLSYGPLQNLAIGEEGAGYIMETRLPSVIHNINEGLDDLHRRFLLSEKSLTMLVFDHKTDYIIDSCFSFSQSSGLFDPDNLDPDGPYILDLGEEPFKDDMIKILSVFTEQGIELPVNDIHAKDSIFTPHSLKIQIPDPSQMEMLSIVYQALHPKLSLEPPQDEVLDINLGESSPFQQRIIIPNVLHSALYSYVAYKTYSNMNTQESSAKAAEHYNMYQSICQTVVEKDLVSESRPIGDVKFKKGGWV